MKKIILVLLNCLICSFAFTQKIQSTAQVPSKIEIAFKRMYPKALIQKWNDESPIWEAKYVNGAEKGAVSFNQDAKVVETELVIQANRLPSDHSIQKYIKSNYPNERIRGYEKITKANGIITFEIQIKGKELVFDAKGNFKEEELD